MKKDNLLKIGLLSRLMEDIRLLFALVKDYWKGNYRSVSPWSIVLFFLGILYLLIPVDILPDFIPFIGQIDDAAIVLLCLYFLERDLQKYKKWKADQ